MLKKAGIVVLGATAGMLSLAPLASAGEAPQHGGDHGHGHHQEHGRDGGGSCDRFAGSAGDRLLSLDNIASNADVSHLNILSEDNSVDGGCGGGGDRTAVSSGDRLISADNLLANASLSHVNALSEDNSITR